MGVIWWHILSFIFSVIMHYFQEMILDFGQQTEHMCIILIFIVFSLIVYRGKG